MSQREHQVMATTIKTIAHTRYPAWIGVRNKRSVIQSRHRFARIESGLSGISQVVQVHGRLGSIERALRIQICPP